MLYQTRDHSSSAVNRVLHDQAHALTGLLYDTLMWTAMTLSLLSKFTYRAACIPVDRAASLFKIYCCEKRSNKALFSKVARPTYADQCSLTWTVCR